MRGSGTSLGQGGVHKNSLGQGGVHKDSLGKRGVQRRLWVRDRFRKFFGSGRGSETSLSQ